MVTSKLTWKDEKMFVTDLLYTYKGVSNKRTYIFFRALKRYLFERTFRISVDIYNMVNTNNLFFKIRKKDRLYRLYGCDIGLHAKIGRGILLPHSCGVVIGDKVEIGEYCNIYQGVTLGNKNKMYPKIGNNVTIYPQAVIIGDIVIGDNAIIGAGSIVLHSVPEGATVAGNPAKILEK